MRRVFREPSLQEQFDRNGYVVVDFLSAQACQRLLEFWRATPSDLEQVSFSNTIMSRDVAYRRSVHEAVAEAFRPAADALLDDYRLCLCSFNAKLPREEMGVVELHQDWTFVDESQYRSIGMWCPLVDVDGRNGCLRVVPGSHRLNSHPRGFFEMFPYKELLDCFEQRYLVEVPMRAGQAFVYTQSLFHSSQVNLSDRIRVAAGGLAIPREAKLRFIMRDVQNDPNRLTVYEVGDEFYLKHMYGSIPGDGVEVGTVAASHEPLTQQRLESVLGGGA